MELITGHCAMSKRNPSLTINAQTYEQLSGLASDVGLSGAREVIQLMAVIYAADFRQRLKYSAPVVPSPPLSAVGSQVQPSAAKCVQKPPISASKEGSSKFLDALKNG